MQQKSRLLNRVVRGEFDAPSFDMGQVLFIV